MEPRLLPCVSRCAAIVTSILFFAIGARAPHAGAQEIYRKNNLPAPGTSYRLQHAEVFNVIAQPGGIDAVWDYATLKPIKGSVDSVAVVDAKSVSGDVPPEADVVITNSTDTRRDYFATLKPSLRSLGYEDDNVRALVGTSPYDIDPIPVKYNVTVTNTVDGSIEVKARPELLINRSGTIRFTPDGSGTLRLPGIPIPQRSIRLRWEEEFTDTVFRKEVALYRSLTRNTRWVWMAENGCTEYLVIENGSVTHERISEDPPKDSLINSVRYYTGGEVTDVPIGDESSLQVMPNPVTEALTIMCTDCPDRDVRVDLYTLLGEHVLGRSVHSSDATLRLVVPGQLCASQTLMLRLSVSGQVHTRFVHIQR